MLCFLRFISREYVNRRCRGSRNLRIYVAPGTFFVSPEMIYDGLRNLKVNLSSRGFYFLQHLLVKRNVVRDNFVRAVLLYRQFTAPRAE